MKNDGGQMIQPKTKAVLSENGFQPTNVNSLNIDNIPDSTEHYQDLRRELEKNGTIKSIGKIEGVTEISVVDANRFEVSGGLSVHTADGGRGKTKVTLQRNGSVLHLDEISLSKAKERLSFIDACGLAEESEQNAVNKCLMQIAMTKPQTETANGANVEKAVLSAVLSDGRIIEALSTNQFAVYDGETETVEYAGSVTDVGVLYKPLNDAITQDGLLIDAVEFYASEAELVADVETYISKHYDLEERELKLSAYYILLSYVADTLHEFPYLHPTGKSGSGKTRFGETIVSACYRPFVTFTATEASLFRTIDRYQPTLFIDEFNLQNSGDDTGIMQILNAGWSKSGKVRRCNDAGEIESFSPFGLKIIASLQKMQSDALESRCLDIQTKETTRKDIRFANTGQIGRDALVLRRKLTMFRFRNLHRDFEAEIIRAETELKNYNVRPRVIQKAVALFALITDKELKRQFIELLQTETRITKELAKESFDFEVVQAIHEILFVTTGETQAELRETYQCELNSSFNSQNLMYDVQAVDGEICEALTIENICERLNHTRTEREKINVRNFGRTLVKRFGLETKQEWKRHSKIRSKRAVIFDSQKLATLFKTYSLPVSEKFDVANVANAVNVANKEVALATLNLKTDENNFNVANDKPNKTNELQDLATLATSNFPKVGENNNFVNVANLKQSAFTLKPSCSTCGLEMDLIENNSVFFCPFGCESQKADFNS